MIDDEYKVDWRRDPPGDAISPRDNPFSRIRGPYTAHVTRHARGRGCGHDPSHVFSAVIEWDDVESLQGCGDSASAAVRDAFNSTPEGGLDAYAEQASGGHTLGNTGVSPDGAEGD